MKKLTEAERRMHLASCCRWKFDGYTIDEEGMPHDCVLVNEANPHLPSKVVMAPKRTCRKVPGKMHYGERRPKCSECSYGLGDSRWAYCPRCGAKIETESE